MTERLLSSVAWYTNPFLIPQMPTLTQIHTCSYNCKYKGERKQKTSQKCIPLQQLNVTKEEQGKKKLRINIRLRNFIIRPLTRDFSTNKYKQMLKHNLKFRSNKTPKLSQGALFTTARCISTRIPQAANWFFCKLL